MKTKIAILALATLSLASCNKGDELSQSSNFPVDGVIRVATSVNGLNTRAGATTDNISELGFCVTNSINTTYSYSNTQMTKSSGVWSSANTMLWQNSTQAVDIVAYAPYQGAVAYTTATTDAVANVKADQSASDESGIVASDFLGVRKSGFIPGTNLINGKVDLELSHLMSKLNITITLGTEFNHTPGTTTNPISDLQVNGTQLKGLCNFTTMAVTKATVDNTAAAVKPFAGAYTAGDAATKNAVAKYESILVPQTVAADDFSVSFIINGKTYEWVSSSAAVTLVGGKQHNLNLTVGKDIITMRSFGSSEWTEGTGGNVETE